MPAPGRTLFAPRPKPYSRSMDRADHERETVEGVCRRLSKRFPDLPQDTVESVVREIHARLSGPIRDYVPVLVEHQARDDLAAIRRQHA